MTSIQDVFKKCSPMMRLIICIRIHVKKALINVLHNHINDPQVRGLPSDPEDLYAFLQTNKRKIQRSKVIERQKSILLPTSSQTVDSSTLDIPMIRFLIRTFCGIENERGGWGEPDSTDQTLFAYVYRAGDMWNAITHDDNIERLNTTEFERKWKQLKEILQGLKYVEDIESFKTETLDLGRCEYWMRLIICIRIHVKKALINVLHNHINNHQVQGLPSDPEDLYAFLQTNKRKIRWAREREKSILLPTSSQTVDSSTFNIHLIRFLIRTFCGIENARGDWKEPDSTDQTLCAYVYRAVNMRNAISHDHNIEGLNATDFEKKWKQLKEILQGLKYVEDIEPLRSETLDLGRCENVILEEFLQHLQTYKEEYLNEPSQDDYILRRFSVGGNRNDIVKESDLETLIKDNDSVLIHGEAGIGKSSLAKRLKDEWCKGKVFDNHNIIYYDSKKINKRLKIQSNAAALYFSELGDHLKKKRRTIDDLSIYNCVKTIIDNFIIVIDGIDEFSVKGLVTGDYLDRLERKVINNEEITGTETIIAIYFGFLFPYSKVVLLGRIGGFESLKKLEVKEKTAIFNRSTISLNFLEFDDAEIIEFTCLKICNPSQQNICNEACEKIYNRIKNIELRKNPTDLNSLIELHKKHPNTNMGNITRTKLMIATLLNRLTNHIKQKNNFTIKTFHEISKQNELSKYLSCIRTLREISFKSLLKNSITVQVVEEQDSNGIVYFEDENKIRIERKTLEELDLFCISDLDYYFILEPRHTINIEFLSACYLFSHPDEWKSILELNKDRELEIIKFIAGLHADDFFTKDFVENVLHTPSYSLEQFLSWLYDVEDVRKSLPNGGYGYDCWFGLMENQKLSPSFYLLDYISHEMDIPQTFIPQTIVCHSGNNSLFSELYNMTYFKHNFLTRVSDKLNLEVFLKNFPSLRFIIKGDIKIENNDEFNLLDQYGTNNLISFRINNLYINASLDTSFNSSFNVNSLHIGEKCDSRTIDIVLDTIAPPITDTTSSKTPNIKCKRLDIDSITRFNDQQTDKLFQLGLSGVVDSISLRESFFTDRQTAILENVERNCNKEIDIQLYWVRFNRMFDLPELESRHISLWGVEDVKDSDLIEFKGYIAPTRYSHNFSNYRIVDPDVPFVKKEKDSPDREQSMFLNLFDVDLRQVSSDVFANTFSSIPSLSFEDVDQYIPSSHWLSLAQTEDSQINEMRIWFPQQKNFEHFLNIKTNIIQFICSTRNGLKELLNHIVNNPNIQLNKEIKVFVVKVDYEDWDHYEEVTLFSKKTIEDYKNNYSSDDILLNNICVLFYEGERRLKWWCCEISLQQQERTGFIDYYDDDESSPSVTKDESNSILVIDETENQEGGNCSKVPLSLQESTSLIDHFNDDESSHNVTNDESNPIFLIDNAENQEGGNCSKISLPLQESTSLIDFNDDESSPNVTNNESNPIFLIDEAENQEDGNCSKIPLPLQEITSLIDHFNDNEMFVDETEDESNPLLIRNDDNRTENREDVSCSFLRKCCCCF